MRRKFKWLTPMIALLPCLVAVARAQSFDNQASFGFRTAPGATLLPPAENPSTLDKSEPNRAQEMDPQIKSIVDRLLRPDRSRILLGSFNRKIVLEHYAQNWLKESTPLGYSISKSLVALTVGQAACDGKLSLDQKGHALAPELAGTAWGNATIRHILTMRSGSAVVDPVKSGWKTDALAWKHQQIYRGSMSINYYDMLRSEDEKKFQPGESFQYSNLDTFALTLIVQSAVGQNFVDYFQEKIWKNVQSAQAGSWLQNTHGQTAGAMTFSASPEDWVRLGHYVLDQHAQSGSCFGKFLQEAIQPLTRTYVPSRCYGYQIWNWCDTSNFMFVGYGGQYLIMNPAHQVVLYAHQASHAGDPDLVELYRKLLASAFQLRHQPR